MVYAVDWFDYDAFAEQSFLLNFADDHRLPAGSSDNFQGACDYRSSGNSSDVRKKYKNPGLELPLVRTICTISQGGSVMYFFTPDFLLLDWRQELSLLL